MASTLPDFALMYLLSSSYFAPSFFGSAAEVMTRFMDCAMAVEQKHSANRPAASIPSAFFIRPPWGDGM